jgi:hypothetical protein
MSDLLEMPANLSKASRFSIYNGYLYMASGAMMLFFPGAMQLLYMEPAFAGREEGLVRNIGMTLAIIGWFYIFGGRCWAKQIVAASVLDRLLLVPPVLIYLTYTGVFPHAMLSFAVLDPVLAIVAWKLLQAKD